VALGASDYRFVYRGDNSLLRSAALPGPGVGHQQVHQETSSAERNRQQRTTWLLVARAFRPRTGSSRRFWPFSFSSFAGLSIAACYADQAHREGWEKGETSSRATRRLEASPSPKNIFTISQTAELIIWIQLTSVVSYFSMIFQQFWLFLGRINVFSILARFSNTPCNIWLCENVSRAPLCLSSGLMQLPCFSLGKDVRVCVCLSHSAALSKRCKLGSPNLDCRLPETL